MNTADIKSAIATLSDNNISPYDLLIAIGQEDVVPQEIVQNRKKRAIARDGQETKIGYLKNALEDLGKLTFKGKEQVLAVIKSNAGVSTLSGYGDTDAITPFGLMHAGFTIIPLLAGADKFLNFTTDWEKYLAPAVAKISPLPPRKLMQLVGGLEMIIGIITAINPKLGGYIIGTWLAIVVGNILASGDNYDVAMRDAVLALSAMAMAKLAPQNMGDSIPTA